MNPAPSHTPPTCETTDRDAFLVDKVPSPWATLPMFVLMLPFTLLGLVMLTLTAGVIIPIYRNRSLAARDRLSRIITFFLLGTARFKLTVIDHNESREEHSKLYVAPHICMLEAMMLIHTVGHIRPMTAEFTRNLPVFGKFVDASDPIYVKRGKDAPKGGVVQLLRESLETTPYRHLVFPEGTFTNGMSLIQFKSGGFVVGKAVTPMVFSYPKYTPFWNRDESSFPMQLYRLVSRIYTPVTIEFLPTHHPSQAELDDPKLYAANVRERIALHSKRPLSPQSLVDSPNYRQDRKKPKSTEGASA